MGAGVAASSPPKSGHPTTRCSVRRFGRPGRMAAFVGRSHADLIFQTRHDVLDFTREQDMLADDAAFLLGLWLWPLPLPLSFVLVATLSS